MDEAFADWAADDAAGDETEGSCGDGNSRAVFKAYFFQNRAEGRRRSVAADEGNRTCRKPHEGIQIEDAGQSYADDILAENQNCRDYGHLEYEDAASLDQA